MKKQLILLLSFFTVFTTSAQSFRDEIAKNPCVSASNYLAYPTPIKPLAKAPKGYTPVYISHYGRHGSRYMINPKSYTDPIHALEKADSVGILTTKGREVLEKIKKMYTESYNRWGELTELGALQHRQIARRMYTRFPEVFHDSVWVDAKSTVVIRCILSMENELQELLRHNPLLRIRHDASEHDMYYMNQPNKELPKLRKLPAVKDAYKQWSDKHVDYSSTFVKLFTDTTAFKQFIKPHNLAFDLFSLAGIVQNSEIRHTVSLYDLYTTEELYRLWQEANVYWYLRDGSSPLTQGKLPFTQRNLLRNILHEADSCLALPNPGATLRFGHETMVLPLTCLLGLNGADKAIDNLENLEKEGWINSKIFPMGCNIQFVFYKPTNKQKSPVSDDCTLVRVLLNEEDATLPIPAYRSSFYRWSDIKAYYTKKLDSYIGK